jgi:hypothetical protein
MTEQELQDVINDDIENTLQEVNRNMERAAEDWKGDVMGSAIGDLEYTIDSLDFYFDPYDTREKITNSVMLAVKEYLAGGNAPDNPCPFDVGDVVYPTAVGPYRTGFVTHTEMDSEGVWTISVALSHGEITKYGYGELRLLYTQEQWNDQMAERATQIRLRQAGVQSQD